MGSVSSHMSANWHVAHGRGAPSIADARRAAAAAAVTSARGGGEELADLQLRMQRIEHKLDSMLASMHTSASQASRPETR